MTHKFTKVLFAVEHDGKTYGIHLPAEKLEKLLAEAARLSSSGSLELYSMPNQELFALATQNLAEARKPAKVDDQITRASEQRMAAMDDTNSKTCEPDFALENQAFESAAVEVGLKLDKLPGGFYVSPVTQHSWAFWIRRAAIAGRP